LIAPWIIAGLLRLIMAMVMVPVLRGQGIRDFLPATGHRPGRHRLRRSSSGAHPQEPTTRRTRPDPP
jgi:hypothetical protein